MKQFVHWKIFLLLFALLLSSSLFADPPNRVARLSVMEGSVTYAPAGVDEWVYATLNRPLTIGDQLWSDTNSRAELQLGATAVRIGDSTSLKILNLDDTTAQFELTQGTLILRAWKVLPNQTIEIDTPNLAFTTNQVGDYRIDVDAVNNTTSITIHNGQAEVYGQENSYILTSGSTYVFSGTDLSNQIIAIAEADAFDQWSAERNGAYDVAVSSKHVNEAVIGSSELETYGQWQSDASYGDVWFPNDMPADWAPYSEGEWTWVEPWGWTWVDQQPWGFAPYHYGRWAHFDNGWGWIPGPVYAEPVYAPALVVFVAATTYLGWYPLGPGDIYIPPYRCSNRYFNHVNHSNAALNPAFVNKAYRDPHQRFNFRNRMAPHAITATPKAAFVGGKPVGKNRVAIKQGQLGTIPSTNIAPVKPTKESVIGAGKVAKVKPNANLISKRVIAKTPPAVATPLTVKEGAKVTGKPLTPASLTTGQPQNRLRNVDVVRNPKKPKPIHTIGEKPGTVSTTPSGKITAPRHVTPGVLTPGVGPGVQPPKTIKKVGTPGVAQPISNVPHPPIVTSPSIIHRKPPKSTSTGIIPLTPTQTPGVGPGPKKTQQIPGIYQPNLQQQQPTIRHKQVPANQPYLQQQPQRIKRQPVVPPQQIQQQQLHKQQLRQQQIQQQLHQQQLQQQQLQKHQMQQQLRQQQLRQQQIQQHQMQQQMHQQQLRQQNIQQHQMQQQLQLQQLRQQQIQQRQIQQQQLHQQQIQQQQRIQRQIHRQNLKNLKE